MKAMLVYQGGIANVFQVECFNLANHGRNAKRLLQADFAACQNFAQGLATAGAVVRTAACNEAGDIAERHWTEDLESVPFSEKFSPVHSDASEVAPVLVITLEGGLVSAVCLDVPFTFKDVIVIDYDTDGADFDDCTEVEQSDGSYSSAIVSHPMPEALQIPLEQFEDDGDEDGDEE